MPAFGLGALVVVVLPGGAVAAVLVPLPPGALVDSDVEATRGETAPNGRRGWGRKPTEASKRCWLKEYKCWWYHTDRRR